MPITDHLRSLQVYEAQVVRVVPREGDALDQPGAGGGLADAYDRVGRGPVLEVLRDPAVASITLMDDDLFITAERSGAGAQLTIKFGTRVVVDEPVVVPPLRVRARGPWFRPNAASRVKDVRAALHSNEQWLYAVRQDDEVQWFAEGLHGPGMGAALLRGSVAPYFAEDLGSRAFRAAHQVRLNYVAGAMAGGIASTDIVIAMARAGLIGFYGAGGVPLPTVERALADVRSAVPDGTAWGFNLLHNPVEPEVEERTVDLYLRHEVRRVSASAYMGLTPALVRYRLHGIRQDPDGTIVCPNHIFAKVSRPEVAARFLAPAPENLVADLVSKGVLTAEQAALSQGVPMAMDITAEADSGGHTDRRPLVVLLPILQRLRDQLSDKHGYVDRPRVGAAGGIATPASTWAAFSMGADYVLTGSINQAGIEAGTSQLAKEMLAEASYTDVTTGPAPDMFEIGADVQVLARGSMYARRARRLYEIYKTYPSMADIPEDERLKIEKQIFRSTLDEVWKGTESYWKERDPKQVKQARQDPRHQMALTFRWYLGMTSRWARTGDEDRKRDFQVWCGPAMGGFNDWVAGSALEPLEARGVVRLAEALMGGAASLARVSAARAQGLQLPPHVDRVVPR